MPSSVESQSILYIFKILPCHYFMTTEDLEKSVIEHKVSESPCIYAIKVTRIVLLFNSMPECVASVSSTLYLSHLFPLFVLCYCDKRSTVSWPCYAHKYLHSFFWIFGFWWLKDQREMKTDYRLEIGFLQHLVTWLRVFLALQIM